MSKLAAFIVDHRVAIAAWALWGADIVYSWLTSGSPLNAHTFVAALVTGWATKRPGDATPKQVAAKVGEARQSAASAGYEEGVRSSSQPPTAWQEGPHPDVDTQREKL